MNSFAEKYPLVVLLAVSVLMLFVHLGLIQTNIMEARNLITAREMVNDGHWIFTTMNGLPRYEKPPLPTWLTAFFMMLGGMHNMFVLRLPVALVCLLLVYFFYKLVKRLQPENNQPLYASLILITSFYIFFSGRDNQWDIYTHAFMVVSIYFLYKVFNEKENLFLNIALAALFTGCSFLSKGPVSLYGLFLSFLIAYFIVYKQKVGKNLLLSLIVLAIGLAIGLSWPLYVKYFDPYAGTALSKQTQNWGNYEVKPFYYYWSFFTQSGLWTIPSFISLMYFYMRKRVSNVKAYTFSFLWTMASLLLLSFIPEKKVRYIMPVLIPLAMNTSFYIQYLALSFKQITNRYEKAVVYFSFGLVAFIGLAVPFVSFFLLKAKLENYIGWYILLVIISFTCSFVIIKGLKRKHFIQVFYASVFFMCGIVVTLIPISKIFYTNSNYFDAANLHNIEKKYNIKTFEGDGFVPEIIWSYGNPISNIADGNSVKMPADAAFGLLVYPDKANKLMHVFNNYSFTQLATVDLNEVPAESKQHNKRIVKNYYLVKRLK
ncbi:ArnT family glycosyltransferase [Parafilimonas terrae]|uniref:4-amino-4-deoxy-L-arabinose transferase n=1 Tax=Parafilimonas terrae TaxID=1465490 RepID=A0A1I5YIA1_9BACT|nr:glycosyltransferase family 39 protein [Parafilimonas terrae]SFQ43905.1 4-amino-4-deoxy-L-arabinose transferase [Parafilimonas terrae]